MSIILDFLCNKRNIIKSSKAESITFIRYLRYFFLLIRTCIRLLQVIQYKKNEGRSVMRKISFIHAADLHLDSPFVGLKTLPRFIYKKIQESTFYAFQTLINEAIQRKVDFVVFAGDLYDGENRSIRAQIRFREGMKRLQEAGIEVFIVHGNHDHLNGNWTTIQMPGNVHVFHSSVETKRFQKVDGTIVHLYGFSYPNKHVYEPMIDEYQKVGGAHFHIGILHGHDRSSKEHYSYAPFTVEKLLEKQFNYWALGHIHKRQILHEHPYIVYPGNIQGRNKKESGEKGAYYVEINEYESNIEFFETADCEWVKETIDGTTITTVDFLIDTCERIKDKCRLTNKNVFLQLELLNVTEAVDEEELMMILQDGEELKQPFVWVYEVNKVGHASFEYWNEFQGDFFEQLKSSFRRFEEVDEALVPLFENMQTRKFIDKLTEDEKEAILEQSKSIMFQLLKNQ